MDLRVARGWGVLVFGACVALVVPTLPADGQSKAPAVDLSGRWRYNAELSDDEQAKTRAAAGPKAEEDSPPSAEPEGKGSEGGRGGRTGGRTAHGRPPQGVDESDPRGAKNTSGAPATLTITQVETAIVVEEAPGQTRELYPNGKTYKADEGATQVRTSWKDGRLLVEKKNVRGWRLVETWEMAPDRSRVVVHLLLEGGSRPRLSLKRVYDRDDASTPK
jgi:hypothetical protein